MLHIFPAFAYKLKAGGTYSYVQGKCHKGPCFFEFVSCLPCILQTKMRCGKAILALFTIFRQRGPPLYHSFIELTALRVGGSMALGFIGFDAAF